MNKIKIISLVLLSAVIATSCQEEHELGSRLKVSDLKFSVTQQPGFDNRVFLENQTPGTIPLWNFVTGTSIRQKDTVVLTFPGDYWIKYVAYSGGGASDPDSVKIHVANLCDACITDTTLIALTNKAVGKTWVLDMSAPIGWAGLDYGKASGDNWNWFPSYSDASWAMPNKDWGEMTFDLNGNYNYTDTQTALNTNDKVTTKGTFALDPVNRRIKFYGTEMLYGGDYHPDVSNWSDVKILELTETSMRLGVVRDQDRAGQGVCLIMFHFKPKP